MQFVRFLPVLLLLIDACIDPLAINVPQGPPSLVVDGMITDQPGPYTVRLLNASKPDTATLKRPTYETGASVWIIDEDGDGERLLEVSTGIYETNPSGIQGQIGKSYYLKIVTQQGIEYSSRPQVLAPAGEIDKLYVKYYNDALVLKESKVFDAFAIVVDAHGADGAAHFRWRWTGTYKGETFPQLRKRYTKGGPVPDPEPCSGYIRAGVGIQRVADCVCCICWATEVSTNAVVSDNRFANDRNFRGVELARLPIDGMRFYEKYYVEVEQLSVSEEVYGFWKLVQSQQRSTGSLFQPNAVRVKGNIKCVTDPEKEALGIFSVSAIAKTTMFIDRSDVALPIPLLDTIQYNCIEGMQGGGRLQKPDFW